MIDNPRSTIRAYHEQTITEAHLIRHLVQYGFWRVPMTLTTIEHGTVDEVVPSDWLVLFTDQEAMSTYEKTIGHSIAFQHHLEGIHAFGVLCEPWNGVVINPHSMDTVRFPAHRLHALRETADGVALEAILQGELDLPDTFARFRRYKGYRVPTRTVEGKRQILLAPDEQGRKLAAIFTTIDAAEAYVKHSKELLGFEPELRVFEGSVLFESMIGMPVDGIVFNCSGPTTPKAVGIQFAQVVLQN